MNEFIVLLENAAGAGWIFLVALGAVAVGMFLFDRKVDRRTAQSDRPAREQKAA